MTIRTGNFEVVWVDSYGWPVTGFRNRPITNFLRHLIHGRKRAIWWRDGDGLRHPRELVIAVRTATGVGQGPSP